MDEPFLIIKHHKMQAFICISYLCYCQILILILNDRIYMFEIRLQKYERRNNYILYTCLLYTSDAADE